MLDFGHTSVLMKETLEYLHLKPGGIYLDGTLGRGGHAEAILEDIGTDGRLYAMDRDAQAIECSKERLSRFHNVTYIQDNFSNMGKHIPGASLDGILLDLGVSSPQLDDAHRGFSWTKDGPLDMRMDAGHELTAEKIINTYPFEKLTEIFTKYGEERFAKRIASAIVYDRPTKPFTSTTQFADFLFRVGQGKREQKKATVMRIFQALRIEVNDELRSLERGLESALTLLRTGGRLVVISFHSLEDRIVKQFFVREAKACICQPGLPICQCDHTIQLKILTKKPFEASADEQEQNSRSKSAKLRAAVKV